MLMRRIAEHLKTQNWTAAGIEFLIVVAGVFLGIQLGNWNEARLEARQERALVMRLIEDARQSERVLDRTIAETAEQAADARRVHETMLAGRIEKPEEAAFRASLMDLGPWQSDGFVRATIDQAIADGSIGVIRSPSLRNTVAQHLEDTDDRDLAVQNVGSMNLASMGEMRKLVDIRMVPDGSEQEFQRLDDTTAEVLSDEELRKVIGLFAFAYTVMEVLHRDSKQMNARYLDALVAYAVERGWAE